MPSAYVQARQQLIDQFSASQPTRGIHRLIRGLTQLTDQTVQQVWYESFNQHVPEALHHSVCLAAVGGYGRSDLLPNSDVDVLVLMDDTVLTDVQQVQINTAVEYWLGTLWDMGLSPSHSVRTVSECVNFCHEDLASETAVLEARFLAGNQLVFKSFQRQFFTHFDLQAFWRNKVAEMRARYARFEETPFSLEPNCKESPGGLRDLHLMMWLSKAAHLADSWQGLYEIGWLNEKQARLIQRCATLQLAIRAHLHILTRRGENRLLFDLQGALAQAFNLHDSDGKRASEHLMQKYYIAARVNSVRMSLFLQKFDDFMASPDKPRIEHKIKGFPEFVEVNHELDIKSDDVFTRNPRLLLDVFYVFGSRRGLTGCTSRLWDAVLKSRELITPEFRRDP